MDGQKTAVRGKRQIPEFSSQRLWTPGATRGWKPLGRLFLESLLMKHSPANASLLESSLESCDIIHAFGFKAPSL